jgi:predicted nucleic acid-binding protein
MSSYFLDTSGLVKRYVPETGHRWVRSLCRRGVADNLYIAAIARVEVVAALCRIVRQTPPRLDAADRDRLIARFRQHMRQQYDAVPVNDAVYTRAADLCRVHPLRAYDAVQLACTLTIRDEAVAAGVPAPIFVCADDVLLAAATAEGLAGENPHAHP